MINAIRPLIFATDEDCLDKVKTHLLECARKEAGSADSLSAKLLKVQLHIADMDAIIRAWKATASPLSDKVKLDAIRVALRVQSSTAAGVHPLASMFTDDDTSYVEKLSKLRKVLAQADEEPAPAAAGGASANHADASKPQHGNRRRGQYNGGAQGSITGGDQGGKPRRHHTCHVCHEVGHSAYADFLQRLHICPKTNRSTPFRFAQQSNPASHTSQQKLYPSVTFLVDSGATHHMISDHLARELALPLTPVFGHPGVSVANSTTMSITHSTLLNLQFASSFGTYVFTAPALVVPELSTPLLSMGSLGQVGLCASIVDGEIRFFTSRDGYAVSSTSFSGLPLVDFLILPGSVGAPPFPTPVPVHSYLARRVGPLDFAVIHGRAAHLSPAVLLEAVSAGVIGGLTPAHVNALMSHRHSVAPCLPCVVKKSERAPFPSSRRHYTRPMQLVHADILDMTTYGRGNAQYLLVLVDAFSCAIFCHPLARKSGAAEAIISWITRASAATGQRLVAFQSDNGGEFKNQVLVDHLSSIGAVPRFTQRTPRSRTAAPSAPIRL